MNLENLDTWLTQTVPNPHFVKNLVLGLLVYYTLRTLINYFTCPEIYGRHKFKKDRYAAGSFRRKQLDALRGRCAQFPKPYPNGWYKLCNSKDLKVKEVISFSALGREFVAFRNQFGKVGVLNAFCPHLGTHLGHGGVVNTKGNLTCPYHLWEFDTQGKNGGIPYCKRDMSNSTRVNAKGYVTYESKELGAIFFWFHADQLGKNAQVAHREPEEDGGVLESRVEIKDKMKNKTLKGPLWDLHSGLKEVEQEIAKGRVRSVCTINWENDCLMHVFEPSQNSADEFHFSTVHQFMPMPFNLKLLKVSHTIDSIFGSEKDAKQKARDIGFPIDRSDLVISENIIEIRLLDLFTLPKFIGNAIQTKVHIQGPSNILFRVYTPFGKLFSHMSLIPIEPFRQRMQMKMYADKRIPWIVGKVLIWWIKETVDQDMQVWEHKLHIAPRNLVLGDGPFAQYSNWLDYFYSDKSQGWESIQTGASSSLDW